MRQVYRSIRDGEHLLLEAATGAGKSIATLYPALKQMSAQQRLFFLTSKTTGAAAALKATQLIAGQSQQLCVVQITAKERVCIESDAACDPHECSRLKITMLRHLSRLTSCWLWFADRGSIELIAAEFNV